MPLQRPVFLNQIHATVASILTPTSPKILEDPKLATLLFLNFLYFYFSVFLFLVNLLSFLLTSLFTWPLFLTSFALILLTLVIFLLSCRTHPQIYIFFNSTIFTLAGPIITFISPDSLVFAMTSSFLAPPLILLLFQTQVIAYLSFALQYIFLNLLFFPTYKNLLMAPDVSNISSLIDEHFDTLNIIYFSNIIILYGIYSLNNSRLFLLSKISKKSHGKQPAFDSSIFKKCLETSERFLSYMLTNIDAQELGEEPYKSSIFLRNAKICGELLLSKIQTLEDLEKIQIKSFELKKTPERVTDFMERFWIAASDLIKKRNLFGTFTIHQTLPPILMLDYQRLNQVLLHILLNSVRFTEKGNIDISVNWLDQPSITDRSFEPIPYDEEGGIGEAKTNSLKRPVGAIGKGEIEGEVVYVLDTHQKSLLGLGSIGENSIVPKTGILKIVISDTGCGMPQAEADRIFKTYLENQEQKDKENPSNRGFNLWMIQQICEQMQGKMKFFSRPGSGTICIICIMAEVPSIEKISDGQLLSPKELKASALPSPKIKSLLIDENSYTSDPLKEFFQHGSVDIAEIIERKEDVVAKYEKEVGTGNSIQLIIFNCQDSLPDVKKICESIRDMEDHNHFQPCAILLILGSYEKSILKECLDPFGKIRASSYVQTPIYFPKLQKLLWTIQTALAKERQEPFQPKKVFLVDDLSFNLQLLERFLEMSGHEFLTADNGEKAVEIYKENWRDIAVIFMDCQMPVMDGYEATQQIRKFQQAKRIPRIKIFGVTGNIGPQFDEICMEAGMDGRVSKPINREEFERIVLECLHYYRM